MAEIQPFKKGALKRPIDAQDEGIERLVNDLQRHMGWSDEDLQNKIVEGIDWGTIFAGGGIGIKKKAVEGAVKVTAKGANIAGQKLMQQVGKLKWTTTQMWTIAKIHAGKYGGKPKEYFDMLRKRMGKEEMDELFTDPKIMKFDITTLPKKTLQRIFNPTVRTLGVAGLIATIGADGIVTWMLSDNIPFIATSLGNKIEWKVRNGDYESIEDYHAAYKVMEIAQDSMALARTKIDNLWSPFTKKYQAEYTANLDQADELIKMSLDVLDKGAKEFVKQMLDPKKEDLEFGVDGLIKSKTYETEEERLQAEKSFMASQEKIEEGKRQKEFDLKRKEQEAQSGERAKMRSQVGIGALSRPPVEQKKRRVPSKLKFGI